MENQPVYLIVGGSSGIGLEVARSLSSEGADVHVVSRQPGPLGDIQGIHHIAADVVEAPFPVDEVPSVLDGLVYCPGSILLKPFARLEERDFLNDLNINLMGAVKTIKAGIPALRKSTHGGAIVLFSTVAVKMGMPFHSSIASAKGAVEGLTRSLAAELAPKIRVNAIAPSLTDTPLAAPLLASEERRNASAQQHPMKRIGQPQDIAAAVRFLLKTESSWMTGQIIAVDGGMGELRLFR